MSKFKVGDKGRFGEDSNGALYEVIAVLPNSDIIIQGVHQTIYRLDCNGYMEGWPHKFHLVTQETKHISYLFADGTATPFRPVDVRVDITKPYVAVVTAIKTDKGFTKHQLQRVDQTEEELTELFEKEDRQPVEEKSEKAKADDRIMSALFGANWEAELASALASGKVAFTGRGRTR